MSVEVNIKEEPFDNEEFEDFVEGLLKPIKTSEEQKINKQKPKRKRLTWNEASEAALLDLWPMQVEELRKQKKNGQIYAEMSDELRKLGYTYSPRDVQVKLQNFTQRYRKEKSPSKWHQYAKVHQIIGGFNPNLRTESILESYDNPSIASSSPSLPSTPIPAPPSPLFSVSPSPTPSTSASAFEPAKKKKVIDFQTAILLKFDNLSASITEYLNKSAENEKELIEIEKKKACSLEKIAKNQEELKIAVISFVNKK